MKINSLDFFSRQNSTILDHVFETLRVGNFRYYVLITYFIYQSVYLHAYIFTLLLYLSSPIIIYLSIHQFIYIFLKYSFSTRCLKSSHSITIHISYESRAKLSENGSSWKKMIFGNNTFKFFFTFWFFKIVKLLIYLSFCLSKYFTINLFTYPMTFFSIFFSVYLSVSLIMN